VEAVQLHIDEFGASSAGSDSGLLPLSLDVNVTEELRHAEFFPAGDDRVGERLEENWKEGIKELQAVFLVYCTPWIQMPKNGYLPAPSQERLSSSVHRKVASAYVTGQAKVNCGLGNRVWRYIVDFQIRTE
jgi:hypothetical protein